MLSVYFDKLFKGVLKMKIIASTAGGYIIDASETEVLAILSAVSVKVKESDKLVGSNIPAFDYAAMIQKCKDFSKSYIFRQFKEMSNKLSKDSIEICESFESICFE